MVCASPQLDAGTTARLNLLLSDTDWREQGVADQLPRLLTPMGVMTYRVNSGREAEDLIREIVVHIAVVDLRLPLRPRPRPATPPPSTFSGGSVKGGAPAGPPASATTSSGAAPGSGSGAARVGGSIDNDGGIRILQLLRRLESPPPTIVVRGQADRTLANQRTLRDALREGAFAVIDSPVQLEVLLETLRRILRRYYADAWPDQQPPPQSPG
ncbi:MAG: hypothetical protein ACOC0P_07585 [Planctomycetota bacterium]